MSNPKSLLSILLGLALLGPGCGPSANTDKQSEETAVQRIALPVQVMRAESGNISEVIEVQARLQSTRNRDLVILSPGLVAELPVSEGEVVEQGQLLLQLDPLPADTDALIQAEQQLARAERALHRLQALQERVQGAVASADIEQAEDAVSDARLALEQARRNQQNRRLIAPFAGVISGVDAVLGQRLESGRLFAHLQEIGSFTIPVRIPETLIPRLSLDLRVQVSPIGSAAQEGRIISLPSAIDRSSGSGIMQVRIENAPDDWRPGAFAVLRIRNRELEAPVVVPRMAIQYSRNRAFVWELHADTLEASEGEAMEATAEAPSHWLVRRSWVSLGQGDEDQVSITEGLQVGAIIVRDGTSGLRDNVPVLPQGLEDLSPAAKEAEEASAEGEVESQGQRRGQGGRPGGGGRGGAQ